MASKSADIENGLRSRRFSSPRAPSPSPQPSPRSTGKREQDSRSPRGRFSPLSAPVWIVVLIASGLPIAWIAFQIVANPHVLIEAIPDAFRLKLLGRTLLYNLAAAGIATMLGLPVGLMLGRGRGVIAKLMWVALPVSLLLPSVTYAYGWSQFFRLIGARFEPAGAADVMRCIWSLATWLWPVPAAAVGLALRRTDTQIQQQALLDGGLWRITFRQLAGTLAAATAMAAVLAVQEFAVYEPTGISVTATEMRMVFETGAFSSPSNPITQPMGANNPGGGQAGGVESSEFRTTSLAERSAAAISTLLPLLIVVALLAGPAIYSARAAASAEDLDVGPWPHALDAGPLVTAAAAAAVILAVIVPTLSLIFSLKVHRSPLEVWDEFSPQILGSLMIAGIAGIVALCIGYGVLVRQVSAPLILSLITFLIGGQLIAIALIVIYNRPSLGWLYNAPPVIVMAFVARFGWIAMLSGRATWSPRYQTLRDMASVDGASAMTSAASVIWPLAWPILAAAGVLVMALSLTEVPATLLLSPQRPPMLTPMLMTWVHMLRYDSMIEASLMLMSIAAALGLLIAGLVWIGIRKPIIVPASVVLLIVLTIGCDKSQPKAIWCDTGTGPAQVVYPRAISYSPKDDSFFIIDRMARVQHLDRKGGFLNEWRMPDWKIGKPVGVTVGPDGNVYVPDTHYQRVMVYTPTGQLLRKWGSAGTGPGQFIYPTDIAFDSKGNIFVSEYGDNDRIQVFDQQGKFLYTFGHFGNGPGEFMRPQSMLIEGDTLYVSDACNHRIGVFKTDGTFLRNMGSAGSQLGQFRYPYGLDMDGEGHLIVCEFGNNRVQMIDKNTGRGIKIWGGGGHDPGQLAYPWGVAVDKHDRVVAVDAGNNRLQVFEF